MNRTKNFAIVLAATLAGGGTTARAATAFSDVFASSTSTVNAPTPGPPTATSTNYAALSSKNATAAIAAGVLKTTVATTSSGLNELQGLFSASPLSLTATGNYVELSTTFSPIGIIYSTAGSGTFGVGLYNSHNSAPVPGGALTSSGLGAGTSHGTGYAADWEGYFSRIFAGAGNAQLITRPAQIGTVDPDDNENQDVLFTNAGGGAFDDPAGTTIGQTPSNLILTNNATYTYTFKLTLAESGFVEIEHHMYEGATTAGSQLFTATSQTNAITMIATQFDALAIGYRATNDGANVAPEHSLSISRIEVTTNLPVTAPTPNANFNGDTSVDGDDFLIWQRGLGLTGQSTIANGDADRNGTVNGADLTVWRNQFGLPPVAASAAAGIVPEPACGSLAVVAGALLVAVRRRRG